MPILTFRARTAGALKARPERYDVFDDKIPGFGLRIAPTGRKTWFVFYRIGRAQYRYTLGTAETVTLKAARTAARDAIRDAANGVNPAAVKRETRTADTVKDLATLYIDKWARPHKRSWKADQRILNKEILPTWKHRPVRTIRRREIRDLVDAIALRGCPTLANRTKSLLSKMFGFAVGEEILDANPAAKIPKPAPEHSRDRVFSETELRALWETWRDLDPPMAALFKTRLLTLQRGQEVRSMTWEDLDLKAKVWVIPAGVTKNKLQHSVPLSASVVTIIRSLYSDKAELTDHVFKNALGKRQAAEASAGFPVKDFRSHDMRRTGATFLASAGTSRLVVAKILNHQEKGVTAVYDRATYDNEKRIALDWWARKLDAIIKKKPLKVLPFQRASGQ